MSQVTLRDLSIYLRSTQSLLETDQGCGNDLDVTKKSGGRSGTRQVEIEKFLGIEQRKGASSSSFVGGSGERLRTDGTGRFRRRRRSTPATAHHRGRRREVVPHTRQRDSRLCFDNIFPQRAVGKNERTRHAIEQPEPRSSETTLPRAILVSDSRVLSRGPLVDRASYAKDESIVHEAYENVARAELLVERNFGRPLCGTNRDRRLPRKEIRVEDAMERRNAIFVVGQDLMHVLQHFRRSSLEIDDDVERAQDGRKGVHKGRSKYRVAV